jgi:hypothetical protein
MSTTPRGVIRATPPPCSPAAYTAAQLRNGLSCFSCADTKYTRPPRTVGRSWNRLPSATGSGSGRSAPGRLRNRLAAPVRSETKATASPASSANCALKLTETPSVWRRSSSPEASTSSGDAGTATEKTSKPKLVTPTEANTIVPDGGSIWGNLQLRIG